MKVHTSIQRLGSHVPKCSYLRREREGQEGKRGSKEMRRSTKEERRGKEAQKERGEGKKRKRREEMRRSTKEERRGEEAQKERGEGKKHKRREGRGRRTKEERRGEEAQKKRGEGKKHKRREERGRSATLILGSCLQVHSNHLHASTYDSPFYRMFNYIIPTFEALHHYASIQGDAPLHLQSMYEPSLVPRLSVGGGKKEPGIHCLCMRLISQKSWEIGNYRVISVKP